MSVIMSTLDKSLILFSTLLSSLFHHACEAWPTSLDAEHLLSCTTVSEQMAAS
jgi:hypothetical protein